jgi:hypothetical protein
MATKFWIPIASLMLLAGCSQDRPAQATPGELMERGAPVTVMSNYLESSRIKNALREKAAASLPPDIQVDVAGHRVYLRGVVRTEDEKEIIEGIVRNSTSSAQKVVDDLTVTRVDSAEESSEEANWRPEGSLRPGEKNLP